MTNLKALGRTVILDITEDKSEVKTSAGIILPNGRLNTLDSAKVIAVGKRVDELKVGDEVYFNKIMGPDFKFEGRQYLAMYVHDLLAQIVH